MRRRLNNIGKISTSTKMIKSRYFLNNPEEQPPDEISAETAAAFYMSNDKDKLQGIEVEENHVYFYTSISDRSSLELVRILRRLDIEMSYLAARIGLKRNPPIHLHIQSPGGDIFAGLNI